MMAVPNHLQPQFDVRESWKSDPPLLAEALRLQFERTILTNWFAPTRRPFHCGLYQVFGTDGQSWCHWSHDRERWGWAHRHPRIALLHAWAYPEDQDAPLQNWAWRGLISPLPQPCADFGLFRLETA